MNENPSTNPHLRDVTQSSLDSVTDRYRSYLNGWNHGLMKNESKDELARAHSAMLKSCETFFPNLMGQISDNLLENIAKSVLCRTHKTYGQTLALTPWFWRDGILTVAKNVVFAGIACGYALNQMPRSIGFDIGYGYERAWALFFDKSRDAHGHSLQDVLMNLSNKVFTADFVMWQGALQVMNRHYEKVGLTPYGVEQVVPMILLRCFSLGFIATADSIAS